MLRRACRRSSQRTLERGTSIRAVLECIKSAKPWVDPPPTLGFRCFQRGSWSESFGERLHSVPMVHILPAAVLSWTTLNAAYAETARQVNVWDPALTPPKSPVSVVFRDASINHFAGKVQVGTPDQQLFFMASLAVSDVLVLNHNVEPRAYYDHTKSATYHANGTRVVMPVDKDHVFTGFTSRDRVTLVGTRGADDTPDAIVVDDQLFMELDGPDDLIDVLPRKVGGIIGLGRGRASSTGAPSVLQSMASRNVLARSVVGLRFDESAMRVTFGGIDTTYCDEQDVVYFHQGVSPEGPWWTVPLVSIHANGSQVTSDGGRALVVDYFDGVVGPAEDIKKLKDAVGSDEFGRLPCDDEGPDLELHLGDEGKIIKLTKKAYTLPPVEEGLCFFAFRDYKHGPIAPPREGEPWVFGLGLLHHVYTVLDLGDSPSTQRIGFAQLKPGRPGIETA